MCCVLIHELIHADETASYAHEQLSLLEAHVNLGGPKRVNTLRFPLEKHFESLAIRVVVDELSDSEIGFVIPDRIIDLQSQF